MTKLNIVCNKLNNETKKSSKLNIIDENKKSLRLHIIDETKKSSRINIVDEIKTPLRLKIVDEIKEPLKLKIVDEIKKPLRLKIIDDNISKLNIVDQIKISSRSNIVNENIINNVIQHPSDHMCYVLKSLSKKIYVGYTIDFNRRIRQHNGEIVGGAKKTEKARPWTPICKIKGFYDKSSALRFEWRIQHSKKPRPNCISNVSIILTNLINKGDGLLSWPDLTIEWI